MIYVRNPDIAEIELKEAAIVDYKAKHTDYQGNRFNFIQVVTDECKSLTEQLQAGELPGDGQS